MSEQPSDEDLYVALTTQHTPLPDGIRVIRLSKNATAQIMDSVHLKKHTYFTISFAGDIVKQHQKWSKALFHANVQHMVVYNPRSRRALLTTRQMTFRPVHLLLHRDIFDTHPARAMQICERPNCCWWEGIDDK